MKVLISPRIPQKGWFWSLIAALIPLNGHLMVLICNFLMAFDVVYLSVVLLVICVYTLESIYSNIMTAFKLSCLSFEQENTELYECFK